MGLPPFKNEPLADFSQPENRQEVEHREVDELWISTGLVFTSELGTLLDPDNLRCVRLKLIAEAKAMCHLRCIWPQ